MHRSKLIFFFLASIIIISIYWNKIDNKVYYLSLGDSLALGITPYGAIDYGYSDYIKDYYNIEKRLEEYVNYGQKDGYRTTDLINDIEYNKIIEVNGKQKTLKNLLVKADLITISIGANDFIYHLSYEDESKLYNYINNHVRDIDKLLKLIREYSKEEVIILGYYKPNFLSNSHGIVNLYKYANEKLKQTAVKNNIKYIELIDIIKDKEEYLPNPMDLHPSKKAYELIAKEIISQIKK